MPVHTGFFVALPAFNSAHLATYERSREERERVAHFRRAEREQRDRERADERERREDQRGLIRDLRGQVDEQRHAAREQLAAVRADPVYDLYRRWKMRVHLGTQYDLEHWRRNRRLVPVTQRTRYTAGGTVKRETLDWSDILDEEADELGIYSSDLPRHFDRIEKQLGAAHAAARTAEEARREADSFARAMRSG